VTSGHRPVLPTTATGSSAGESDSGDPRAPMDGDAAPVTLGRYRIGKLLGAGGMGSVYEAYDPELERVVAVKVLREDREATISRERRLIREAKVMARLAHPNVMRVYDVGVAEGRVYLAMEHVQGVTLEHWLAREPRSVAEILGSFAAAGQGLAAAHDAGLVHRDFKPSNVMVSDDGRVLVTDFGLARSVSDLEPADGDVEDARAPAPAEPTVTVTHSGVKVGTPQYMAPEQRAAGSVDARADQFSFCVSVWDALYGALPYSDGAAYARGETALRSPSGPNVGRVPNVVAPSEHACLARRALARSGAHAKAMGTERIGPDRRRGPRGAGLTDARREAGRPLRRRRRESRLRLGREHARQGRSRVRRVGTRLCETVVRRGRRGARCVCAAVDRDVPGRVHGDARAG